MACMTHSTSHFAHKFGGPHSKLLESPMRTYPLKIMLRVVKEDPETYGRVVPSNTYSSMPTIFLLIPSAILINHLKSCIPRPVHEIQAGVSKFIFIIAISPGSNLVKPGQLDKIAGD